MTEHPTLHDEVVAHFLDGDSSRRASGALPAELADHLASCEECRDYLARGRRLDALLATATRSDVDPGTVDRLFDGVRAAVAEPAHTTASQPSWLRRTAPKVALVACGFAVAVMIGTLNDDREPDPAPVPATPVTSPVAAAPAPPFLEGAITVPDLPRTQRERSTAGRRPLRARVETSSSVARLEQLASHPGLEPLLRPSMVLRAAGLGLSRPTDLAATARRVADRMRTDAALQLANSPHREARAALMRVLAHEPAGDMLDATVAQLRNVPAIGEALARALAGRTPSRDGIQVAALLGSHDLDATLRDAVKGDVPGTERVAATAGRIGVRPGRIALLLALWSDLQRRGLERAGIINLDEAPSESIEEARARRWFAKLPAPATAELIAIAQRSRHAEERRRCLMALAARGDAAAIDYLLDVARGRRHEESLLAAYALGRCPAAEIEEPLQKALRGSRRPELLWAALAGAGGSAPTQWRELPLTPEEQRFLAAGSFNLEQFAIAAAMLRRQRDLHSTY